MISTGDRWCVFSLSSLECTLIFINAREEGGMVRERLLYPLISHGKFSLMDLTNGSLEEDDDEGGSFDGRNSLTFVEPMISSLLPKSMIAPILCRKVLPILIWCFKFAITSNLFTCFVATPAM